jgi:Na+/H+ antiporter NhaD/arsenite permease-like protein
MLLCIAVLPLILKHHWEANYHFIALGLATASIAYYVFVLHNPARLLHEGGDYVSFMALIGSLFVAASGIHIEVRRPGTPLFNVSFLFCGSLVANLIGTTGASMLLIRPWIQLNRRRFRGFHTAFFIFLLGNIGGGLTPIGDPPLFVGYLKGVPFWWVIQNCWREWAVAITATLLIFFLLDRRSFAATCGFADPAPRVAPDLVISGLRNIWFLAVIVAATFLKNPPFLREAVMVAAAACSYWLTPRTVHEKNRFTLKPIKEVAWLFFGIFATMVPMLDFMKLHADRLALNSPARLFWVTGLLSSTLDNVPTYLTFFAAGLGRFGLDIENVAHVQQLVASHPAFIAAISIGAVFFGAATYIGNGPNLMVKAICEEAKVATPSFLGYIVRYTLPFLLPVCLLISFLFFR